MTSLQPYDGHLHHHPDGSHRWSGGPTDPRRREAYLAVLRAHLELHRCEGDGEPHLLAQPMSVLALRRRPASMQALRRRPLPVEPEGPP